MWIVLEKPVKETQLNNQIVIHISTSVCCIATNICATFKAANQQIHRNSSSDTNVDFNNEEINTDLANAFPQGEKNLKVRMHLLA